MLATLSLLNYVTDKLISPFSFVLGCLDTGRSGDIKSQRFFLVLVSCVLFFFVIFFLAPKGTHCGSLGVHS